MSSYNGGGRRQDVTQFLRDLNSLNTLEPGGDDDFNIGADDLSLFRTTQFYDYDTGEQLDFQAQPVKVDTSTVATPTASPENPSSAASAVGDMSGMEFINNGEFHFPNFDAYHGPSISSYPDGAQNFPALQPNHGSVYAGRGPQQQQQQARFQAAAAARAAAAAEKHDAEVVTPTSATGPPATLEDASRQAAEEDKRRRNTAASARFRVKKKQREQALEKSAKEMTDKVNLLESRVSQLETENKWLKNLLVEKNEGNEDISALWKEFTKHASKRSKGSKDDLKGEA